MQRYSEKLVEQARKMVTEGMSGAEVARSLGVNNGTIGVWCRDARKSQYLGLVKYNKSKRKALLDSEKSAVSVGELDSSQTKLLCGLLYGCEGAKYPASNRASLANSDPELVKVFVSLMRKAFVLDESKWRAHLQVHTNQNYSELVDFWSRLLSLPTNKFLKPTITVATGKKHRNDYLGTCSVRYDDFRIQLKLIGIFREFLRKCSS